MTIVERVKFDTTMKITSYKMIQFTFNIHIFMKLFAMYTLHIQPPGTQLEQSHPLKKLFNTF